MLRQALAFLGARDLYAWVFVTGAIVLAIEVVAVRILAPFFGNTLFSVSSVLSVILLALSVGYWVGGTVADKNPSRDVFYSIILSSGLLLLTLEVIRPSILEYISDRTSIVSGPLVSALILFIGPALLLGMLSPLAIKISIDESKKMAIGRTTGGMFFWSTLGSISGSLLAGFYLIPTYGVDQIMLSIGVALILLGAVPLIMRKAFSGKRLAALVGGVLLLFFLAVAARPGNGPGVIYAADGIYEKVIVRDATYRGQEARFLLQNKNASSARFPDSDELVFDYTRYYKLYQLFDVELEHAVVLGGGGYSVPQALLREPTQPIVDVVEIEPTLYEVSKEYLGLEESDRLHNHIIDGRRFLTDSTEQYDLIFGDVFINLLAIPSHFTTVEFFELVAERLDDNGVFISNLIGDTFDGEHSFTFSQLRTIQSVFPNSHFFAVTSPVSEELQNIMMIARKGGVREDIDFSKLTAINDPVLHDLASRQLDIQPSELERYDLLTDNYAPIDFLVFQQLNRRKE